MFAQRHRRDLNHAATVEELAASIRMLKRAGRWPFTEMLDEAPANATAATRATSCGRLLWLLLWRWFEFRTAGARAASVEREQAGSRERSAVSS